MASAALVDKGEQRVAGTFVRSVRSRVDLLAPCTVAYSRRCLLCKMDGRSKIMNGKGGIFKL